MQSEKIKKLSCQYFAPDSMFGLSYRLVLASGLSIIHQEMSLHSALGGGYFQKSPIATLLAPLILALSSLRERLRTHNVFAKD